MKFVSQPLYGGAIATNIPAGLLDASTIRQIPDTQEVFLNPSTNDTDLSQLSKDDTIIIELLEKIDKGDKESILEHLSELGNLNSVGENEWQLVKYEKVELSNFK